MRTESWWKSAVVYQIYPRSFADSNGDGVGDLAGIISRLDYLELLGVDVLWLSPIYKSPQDDNGYDISDYEDIDPVFGSLADLDALIAEVHRRDMKLVMDLVVNHTSDEHPWFLESRSSRTSPKRDWYWWRSARPDRVPGSPGAEPTNWRSYFSGPAWEYDAVTGEYFLHQFTRRQPDLNWENPDVRRAVYDMMNRWIERGVDGFRMDVINLLSKTEPFTDGHMYVAMANGPRMHEFLQEMNREVLAGRHLFTVGEMPGVNVEQAEQYTDPERNELNMVFTFEHMHLDAEPSRPKWSHRPLPLVELKKNLTRWQTGIVKGWNSLYWNNHDQPRSVSRWGNDVASRVESAKAWATVLHMMRGTPYVYQGEEIGMTNFPFESFEQFRDVESLNWIAEARAAGSDDATILDALRARSRDNARTPMQWDATTNGGFTNGEPWIAVNPNHRQVNASLAVADPDSVFHHYRRLISLRHELPVVVDGDFRLLMPDDQSIFAFVRSLGPERLLVVANLSDDPRSFDVPSEFALGEILVGTLSDLLGPWQSCVVYASDHG
ncbi:MAG: glycoside hydrolase family 13 protein [Actinomycetota bacterium]